MKKIMFKLAVFAIAVSAVQSCKKGEDDPFLSLRSRKARLTGEWNVTSYQYSSYEDNILDYQETFDGTLKRDLDGETWAYSQTFTFEKDGTYASASTEDGASRTWKGNWAFLGKSKASEAKKKEYLLLDETTYVGQNYTSTNSNFSSGNGITYHLKKLSNKEVIIEYSWHYTDSDGYNIKEEETFTLTKK